MLRIRETGFKIKFQNKNYLEFRRCIYKKIAHEKNDSVFKKLFCNCVCAHKMAGDIFND